MNINLTTINKAILVSITSLTVSGCGISLLSERASNPVIQDWAHPFLNNSTDIFATKASHRLVLVQRQPGQNINSHFIELRGYSFIEMQQAIYA